MYSSRLPVTFNQPFTPYQHPPPPSHRQPATTSSFTHRQTPAPLQLSHVPQSDAPLNTANNVFAPETSNTQPAFPRSVPQSLLLNTTDEYFDDELYVTSNNYTNEATIDSQATLPDLQPVIRNMDNQDMYNMHSPTTPSSRLYIPPTQGRREYPSVITAPSTFDARKINLPEGTVQMQSGEILSSTRVPLQPDHTACLPQPAPVAPHPSIPTQAVTNSLPFLNQQLPPHQDRPLVF